MIKISAKKNSEKDNIILFNIAKLMRDNNFYKIKYLIEKNNFIIDYVDDLGRNLLHLCILNCYSEEILQYIISKGIDIESISIKDNNRTSLAIAIQRKKTLFASTLILNNADLSVKDKYNNTLLHLSIKSTTNESKIDFELINYLIKSNKIDLNAYNNQGKTALYNALENIYNFSYSMDIIRINENYEVAKLLINNGSKIVETNLENEILAKQLSNLILFSIKKFKNLNNTFKYESIILNLVKLLSLIGSMTN